MRTRRNIANGMKGFFDPVIGGALLLVYGAVALLTANGQHQEEDYQATASATQQVASANTGANHAQDRQGQRR